MKRYGIGSVQLTCYRNFCIGKARGCQGKADVKPRCSGAIYSPTKNFIRIDASQGSMVILAPERTFALA
jgi:hypothetical protein